MLTSCINRGEKLQEAAIEPVNSECEISIMFGGDVMLHQPQIDAARNGEGGYSIAKSLLYIKDSWAMCDAVVFNLETTLSDKNYSGYPLFAAPREVTQDLQACGVTHVMLANNHICDRGAQGIRNTLRYVEEASLESAGCYVDSLDLEKRVPIFIKKEGFNIALLNYTYGTNGMPIPTGMIVPLLDTTLIAKDIAQAKEASATNIITFVHWGNEYQSHPSIEQKRLAAWLRAKGVDIVVGSHPHVIQPTQVDSTGATIYSLGNLISNQRKHYTNGGLLVKLDIVRDTCNNLSSYEITHLPHFVYKAPLGDHPRYYCTPHTLVDSIIVEAAQRAEAEQFFSDTEALLSSSL
ncbi:MAG: CapA family protein [Rikenellaceae bacterium]